MYANVDGNEAILSIGILVVNDDQACQNIVAELLRCCNYQVLHTGTVYDALHAIWENKDRLDLVITNVRKLKSEGLAIIQNIEQKLNLNVLAIGNAQNIEPGGKMFSFSAYALNGLSIISFSLLLEKAKLMVKHKMAAENVERATVSNAAVEANKGSSSSNDAEEASRDGCPKGKKKQRVAWTVEMHRKFVDAVDRLGGYETAFPKKIVEVMGIPWLTREHVASHLQKYRGNMKSQLQGLGVLTSPSASSLAAFRANLPAFPQSSISSIKESKLKYSRKHSYGSISRCKFYPTTGASRLNSDRSSTASSKFVGYRFHGNKIDYGPIKKIKTDDEFSPTLSSSRVQQSSTSSVYPHREDLSLSKPEVGGNDESRAALAVDDMLQQHCSPPSPLPQMLQDLDDEMFYQDGDSVMENACDQFDFLELDDTLYSQDD